MWYYNDRDGIANIVKSRSGAVTIVLITTALMFVCHRLLRRYKWVFSTVSENRTNDPIKNREAQLKAREAAEKRHNVWKALQKQKKRASLQSLHNPLHDPDKKSTETLNNKAVVHRNVTAATSMSMEEIVAASLPVYDDGFIMFRNLFQMPNADQTASTLRRLAQEFIPIIRQRQYNVTSVSEFCCCGDGMDYQFGGQSLSVRPGERISGHESERVMGYNRVILPNGKSRHGGKQYFHIDTERYTSSIHLRLRSPYDHSQLIPYEQVCEHFCHELAHCVYHDHSTEFYALMRDIQIQYKRSVR